MGRWRKTNEKKHAGDAGDADARSAQNFFFLKEKTLKKLRNFLNIAAAGVTLLHLIFINISQCQNMFLKIF